MPDGLKAVRYRFHFAADGLATRGRSGSACRRRRQRSTFRQDLHVLQRLRELAVASGNGSYGGKDRATLQQEANEILNHINGVAAQTQFNGEALFSQDRVSIGGDEKKRAVLDGLKSGWLSASEKMLKDNADKISGDSKSKIESAVNEVKEALKGSDTATT